MIHNLKTVQPFFRDIKLGKKNFEIRKDDRLPTFEVGDSLCLMEYKDGRETGYWMVRKVTYILRDAPEYGLMSGYCIMGIK